MKVKDYTKKHPTRHIIIYESKQSETIIHNNAKKPFTENILNKEYQCVSFSKQFGFYAMEV